MKRRITLAVVVALIAPALVAAAPDARARQSRDHRPRNEPIQQSNDAHERIDDVEAFLTRVHEEFMATGSARAGEIDIEWIAPFFLEPASDRRRRSRDSSSIPMESRVDIEVDEVGVEFYMRAREFAYEYGVSNPQTGRARLSRNEERPTAPQWWLDFIFATQRRYFDCATDDDCQSRFHLNDGPYCCDAGVDFYGNFHNSCVADLSECIPSCDRSFNPFERSHGTDQCRMDQFCCKRRNRSHDYNVCVDKAIDCEDYCDPAGDYVCPDGQSCCYVDILRYTTCVDDNGFHCPSPPPECLPDSIGTPCQSDPERICCGETCCQKSDTVQCCQLEEYTPPVFACVDTGIPGASCPEPHCPECPAGSDFWPAAEENAICCHGVACAPGQYCCWDGMMDQRFCSDDPCDPAESCADMSDLTSCGSNRLCCSGVCCEENFYCCPVIVDGTINGYACAEQCTEPICRFIDITSCDNNQAYGVCGGCGNSNCALACQTCVDPNLNDPARMCEYTSNGILCEGTPTTCGCNNGGCGGAVGCFDTGGNCCACGGNGMRGGCQCLDVPATSSPIA